MSDMKPNVSVIVTTRNSEATIELCLRSLEEQSFKAEEIIVVDNNSTDRTKKIASRYTQTVFNHGPERSAQRNFGAKRSSGRYVLFIDSDMELSEDVIKACVETLERNNNRVGIYIPEIIAGNSLWSKVRTFERSFYNATSIDAVRCVTRDAFEKVSGFDENLTGPEDWDFDKRIRQVGKTGIIREPIVHHEEAVTIKSYLSKKIYYSSDFKKYILKWGKDDPDIKKQFGFYSRFIGVFVENGKWRRLLSNPILAIVMYALRIRLGLWYIQARD